MLTRDDSRLSQIHRHSQAVRRSGVAAVEFGVVMLLVMVPTLIGVWEIGRLIHVQQIVANAAREGARLAAQARTINQVGAPTEIVTEIPPATNTLDQPNVKAAVIQSLHGAGLTNLSWDDVTVTFAFLDSPSGSIAGATEPFQGVKNQRFAVTVTIPFNRVRWSTLGLINPTTVSYRSEWRIMVDDPFNINTSIPSF